MPNFSQETMMGGNEAYRALVAQIRNQCSFDFVGLGLAAFHGSPLKWVYTAGETSNRSHRIALALGHGIGGLVLQSGKPSVCLDIDADIDPREFSSYPIVFAEDLHSFAALPLTREGATVGALIFAFRSTGSHCREAYKKAAQCLGGRFADMEVVDEGLEGDDWSHLTLVSSAEASEGHLLNRSSAAMLISAQEEERRRISRELHDGIAQELLAVKFALQSLTPALQGAAQLSAIDNAQSSLDYVLEELHNISVDLRPSTLDHFGLFSALRSSAARYTAAYGVRVEFAEVGEVGRFDPAYETQIYRICQEALLNACKYSGCELVSVAAEAADGWLSIGVFDTGVGFDVDRPVIKGSGCGLSGMRERANLIGAKLEIESGAGGTSVKLTAPMGIGGEES